VKFAELEETQISMERFMNHRPYDARHARRNALIVLLFALMLTFHAALQMLNRDGECSAGN
jgi:hypothetical protein